MLHQKEMLSKCGLSAFSVSFFQHVFVLLLLTDCCKGQSQVVGPPQPVTATVGDDVMLPCNLKPATDAVSMTLEWARPDLNPSFVHVWHKGKDLQVNQHPSYKGRTSLAIERLKHGDISLKLSKVKLSDTGKYRCYLPDLNKESTVELVVAGSSSPLIGFTPAAFYSILVLIVVIIVSLILLICYLLKNKETRDVMMKQIKEKKDKMFGWLCWGKGRTEDETELKRKDGKITDLEEKLWRNADMVDGLKEQKPTLENQKYQMKLQLEEVEKKKEENEEKLLSVENKITEAENKKTDKRGLLTEKGNLTDVKWKLDEQKTNWEKLILTVEQILQKIDVLVSSDRVQETTGYDNQVIQLLDE